MAVRINTNVSALNTLRMLDKSGAGFARSVSRLSSGFRINNAADDAAGLGIANTMRADIRVLTQASRNAEQGRSLLQVAEGAGSEIQNILERMKELAAQSASSSSGDRTTLNSEFNTLTSEIARIVSTTKFQGTALVDGSFGQTVDDGNSTIDSNGGVQLSSMKVSALDTTASYTLARVDDTTVSLTDGSTTDNVTVTSTGVQTVSFGSFGVSFETNGSFDNTANGTFSANNVFKVTGSTASFLVSSSAQYTGDDLVSVGTLDLRHDNASGVNVDSSEIDTQANAQSALAALDTAISQVSTTLATIGAAQNRIDFAKSNTDATIENFAAAESIIRDVDMAREVTQMTKFQILQQAGTAMLAQANAAPQSVLQLLG